MAVLLDTSVWSLALRRSPKRLDPLQSAIVGDIEELVRNRQVRLIDPLRQELLTGIREPRQFDRLRAYLRAFPDAALSPQDYEAAAAAANQCIAVGIAVHKVDLLICAVSINRHWEIYTTDGDFLRYSRRLPIRLRQPPRS